MATATETFAREIYERSVAAALAHVVDPIESGDDVLWVGCESRSAARAYYAAEFGIPFTRVRATRECLAPDLSRIEDLAHDLAAQGRDEVGDAPIAYTYDGEGFYWTAASKDAPGAVFYWRCEPYAPALRGGADADG